MNVFYISSFGVLFYNGDGLALLKPSLLNYKIDNTYIYNQHT